MAPYPDFEVRRRRMVDEQIIRRGVKDPRVLSAVLEVPRHLFIDEGLWGQAYEDHPVSIGLGQTISQPYIVALMTEALQLRGDEKVLEIGTGSGYQTAVLAKMVDWVYSIERLSQLSRLARSNLEKARIFNATLEVGDGTKGWPEEAPFQAIIVTAGGPQVPDTLKNQLAVGGRMLIPTGSRELQYLKRLTRTDEGFQEETLGGVRFVDLVGMHGW